MGEFDSVDEILDFAVFREAEAHEFYKALAGRAENPAMAELILEFARDELEHKAKLELELMKRGSVVSEEQRAEEARELDGFTMADHIAEDGQPLHMNYEDLLLLGMQKEKASFRLYVELAAIVKDAELRETLLSLAEEEARHKVQLEIDYDDLTVRRE
ncbi:MAG: ferritin family protein [Planctomycetota bacterium]|jgi:rubrerythrin